MLRTPFALPTDYNPRPVKHFDVERIILSKGSLDTPERESFVRRICDVYPKVPIEEQLDTAHNGVTTEKTAQRERLNKGKRTLVLGELKNPVKQYKEKKGVCPAHWSFSVYGFCPYRCSYCYLNGSPNILFSPNVKLYVNLPEIVARINHVANRLGRTTTFHLGKTQDGLALDPLAAYGSVLMPFFAKHRYAKQAVLTKSACVEGLLKLEHNARTSLSWSLSPPSIAKKYEANSPPVAARIEAMIRCAHAGYPVRAVIMPVIPCAGWQELYGDFVRDLVSKLPLQRLSVGGICMSPAALSSLQRTKGEENDISMALMKGHRFSQGRVWYTQELSQTVQRLIVESAHSVNSDLHIAPIHG
jgi:spore photoproduct lyase